MVEHKEGLINPKRSQLHLYTLTEEPWVPA